MQHRRLAKLRARSFERIADGEEDGTAHEKWRFTYTIVSIYMSAAYLKGI